MTPFRAPDADGGLLAVPAVADFAALLDRNRHALQREVTLAGVPLAELRTQAQAEVQTLVAGYHRHFGETLPANTGPFFVAGHQPELFHAGVWAKNFALHRIAVQHSGTPLNLIVDNDTIKTAELAVPVWSSDPTQVQLHHEPFDHLAAEIPYEEYRVQDQALFAQLPERLASMTAAWRFRPMLFDLWPAMVATVQRGCSFGNVVAAVRRQQERTWGITNHELPVSRLAETSAFRVFTQHVLQNLPAFHTAYNTAILDYRRRHRLRSQNHPAPELTRDGSWWEAPFWVWHREQPTRRKLFVRATEQGWEWRANDERLPTSWEALADAGWKVRPRALTLTLFVRLCLADVFIHGIGGGKYDEVTDDLCRRFFSMEPPGYAVISATLRLPLSPFTATDADRRAAQRNLRDLRWNPQANPTVQQAQPDLVQAKQTLAQHEPAERGERRHWFRTLQHLTAELRPMVAAAVPEGEARLQHVEQELAANRILRRRDYAWPLFPEASLHKAFSHLFPIDEDQRAPLPSASDR